MFYSGTKLTTKDIKANNLQAPALCTNPCGYLVICQKHNGFGLLFKFQMAIIGIQHSVDNIQPQKIVLKKQPNSENTFYI